jgi:hypothetical protein
VYTILHGLPINKIFFHNNLMNNKI